MKMIAYAEQYQQFFAWNLVLSKQNVQIWKEYRVTTSNFSFCWPFALAYVKNMEFWGKFYE